MHLIIQLKSDIKMKCYSIQFLYSTVLTGCCYVLIEINQNWVPEKNQKSWTGNTTKGSRFHQYILIHKCSTFICFQFCCKRSSICQHKRGQLCIQSGSLHSTTILYVWGILLLAANYKYCSHPLSAMHQGALQARRDLLGSKCWEVTTPQP